MIAESSNSMNLTPNQENALNIDRHICVTAGAGSGKTTVLVDRYLEILKQDDVTPEQVVAITFTDKAAAEMKSRIVEKLNEVENVALRNRHIEQMNTAPISTIHSFCGNILREFPFQAGVPANFNIIQGIDQKLLLNQTIQENLSEIANSPDHLNYESLRHSLQRFGNRKKLFDLLTTLMDKRDILDPLIESVYSEHCNSEIPEVWKELFLDQLPSENDIDEFLHSLSAVLEIATGKNTTEVEVLTSKLEMLAEKNPDSPDIWNLLNAIVCLITISSDKIAKRDFLGNRVDVSELQEEINLLESVATKIKSAPTIDHTNTETDDLYLLETTKHLLTLYRGIRNDYQNNKLAQGKLDFTDLQLMTRDLLKSNEIIRNKLIERHSYYMIDEYQDTNEVQYQLVMLLTNHLQDANLFIVGDPKQSIFGFRGADVRIFNKTRTKIEENGGENIQLKENFRSLRIPVGFVNHFFESLMGDGTQSEFDVPFEALTKGRSDNEDGGVEILLGNRGEGSVSEYRLIAHHINRLVADGRNYEEIAILIRSRSHLADLEEALISAGIPYLTTGGVGFYQRQEIYDIWNYLNFLNNPEKNHTSLVGILRGPAFGISDTELYEISLQRGNSFWVKAKCFPTPSTHLSNAIDMIEKQIQFTHRIPVNQLIHSLVNDTGLVGTLNLGRQGQQRYANYQKLLDLARQFDSDENSQTLSDFITFLDILITDEPREGQAPIDNISGSVEIMTVHSAKGKQFPVVILPCLHRRGGSTTEPFIDEEIGIGFSPLNPDDAYTKTEPEIVEMMKVRASEKDEAEKKRLFYVAATRARDRLVLSGALNKSGKTDNLLKWLFEHLGISDDGENVKLDVDVDEYSEQTIHRNPVQLNIPIIDRIDVKSLDDTSSNDLIAADFPELPLESLQQSSIESSYSVNELADYARCPLRYQLEHVLRIPPVGISQSHRDSEIIDYVVRSVLLQVNNRKDRHYLERIIERAYENCPDTNRTSLTTVVREQIIEHVMNFQNSEIAEMIHASTESEKNRSIHADINGQIISCRIDRTFKDQVGRWNGMNFITNSQYEAEYYEPEMELICLLLHKSYPEQESVTLYYYNSLLNQYRTLTYSDNDFRGIIDRLNTNVVLLQQGNYNQNLSQCSSCHYADSQEQCIVR